MTYWISVLLPWLEKGTAALTKDIILWRIFINVVCWPGERSKLDVKEWKQKSQDTLRFLRTFFFHYWVLLITTVLLFCWLIHTSSFPESQITSSKQKKLFKFWCGQQGCSTQIEEKKFGRYYQGRLHKSSHWSWKVICKDVKTFERLT